MNEALRSTLTSADYIRVLPELVLSVFGMIVMLADTFLDDSDNRKSLGVISALGILSALGATFYMAQFPGLGFYRMVRVDSFSVFFHVLVLLIALACVLMSFEYLDTQRIRHGEWYALILMGTVGMGLMSSAIELVMIFIAIEISSISTYILAGFRRTAAESAESSIKYFLLGSFATAFFLYGVAMIFGATGSTHVDDIAASLLSRGAPMMAFLAVALMFVGLGFKVAAAPFQVWTPDVYEGAPAPIVAFMSTGPKAAAFAVLLRVLYGTGAPGWFWMIWVSAALSMTLGNIGAIVQPNVKRMLAYSSIAHAGYILVAFAAAGSKQFAISAVLFYTASYAAMNAGAFAVVGHLAGKGEKYVSVDDYSGLGRRSPLLAAVLTLFLLSLIGIPITGGFFAKFYVFSAALKSNLVWLVVIGVINSAIASFYYLRLVVVMYMREPKSTEEVPKVAIGTGLALAMCALATLYLGVFPNHVLSFTMQAAKDLLR